MSDPKPMPLTDKEIAGIRTRMREVHEGFLSSDVPKMTADLNTLLSALDSERAARAAAERYGAPIAGAKALSFVKNPCKRHNEYWTTAFGECMACRAVAAEADRDRLAAENADLRAVVERREQATENLIRSAIATADFIEGEYADGNDDGDIIPVSSPAHKVHERLWGAIFKADLPDGAVTLAARTEARNAKPE